MVGGFIFKLFGFGWFQLVSGWFQLVSGFSWFSWFQVASDRFSNYTFKFSEKFSIE